MRKLITLILILFCINSYSQSTIYVDLKDSVVRNWIKSNPSFIKTKNSFFTKENSKNYFIAPVQISGYSIPFTWDCDLSILKFLTTIDSRYIIIKGKDADKNYMGTKVKWENPLSALIWIDNHFYETYIDNWYLFGVSDCPGNSLFPLINFKKIFELSNAITNNLSGLVIIPFNEKIVDIHKSEIKLKTIHGKEIKGLAYDINNDNIQDVFIYYENLDDEGTTGYRRLYINIEGEWICKWIALYEVCI